MRLPRQPHCPDTFNNHTIDMYPLNPSMENYFLPNLLPILLPTLSPAFTYSHLYAPIFICHNFVLSECTCSCFYLWSFAKIFSRLWSSVRIYKNLLLSVRIYSYSWSESFGTSFCLFKSLWKQAMVWTPSSRTNFLSLKNDNYILLTSYILILCFLLWVLLLCLITFLLKQSVFIFFEISCNIY